ncbi:MAG TPA: DUF2092 domain-containing protein, partial [Humisphaera sp.]
MLDRATGLYGVMDVGDTIDKAIDDVEDRFGVEIPLGDVLVADPYRNMMEAMDGAADLGRETVLGVACNHLAFTGPTVDCQVWVAEGPRPLPRKVVVNFKSMPGSPQVTQIFSDWDLTSPISDATFEFVPPAGSSRIVVNPKRSPDAAPAK